MSPIDTLERQLADATRRRYGPRRRARFHLLRGRRQAAARVVALTVVAALLAFAVTRSTAPPDEREAAVATPSATWTPMLGDEDRGRPSISRSPAPSEQLAALGILRRPAEAADRSRTVEALLAGVSSSSVRGVRVDAIRRLDERYGRTTVLLSVALVRMDPRDPDDDIRDGLCLLSGAQQHGTGMTCGSFDDAIRGRMRWTLPPRGLAPDGAVRVRVRVRGGRTVTVTPHNNYYDLSWVGEARAAGIARPRFYDAAGREL